jgi:hypothetical protein
VNGWLAAFAFARFAAAAGDFTGRRGGGEAGRILFLYLQNLLLILPTSCLPVDAPPFGVTPPTGELPNGRAGICLAIAGASGHTLAAQGKIMVTNTNVEVACSTAPNNTAVVLGTPNCRSAHSTMTAIGVPSSIGLNPAGTNAIDATHCLGQ